MNPPSIAAPRSDKTTTSDHKRPRRGVIAAIAAVSLAAGAGAVGLHWVRETDEIKARAVADLTAIADLKMAQIISWRSERLSDARFLAASPDVIADVQLLASDPNAEPARTHMRKRLELLKGGDRYEQIKIFASDQRELASVSSDPAKMPAPTPAEIDAALNSRQVVLSDLHPDSKGVVHMNVLAPIFATEGAAKPIAAILLRLDPRGFLYPLIQQWPLPSRSAEFVLARREGEEVVFLNELRHHSAPPLKLREPMDKPGLPMTVAMKGRPGVIEGRDYRGEPVVTVVYPVPDSPWFMAAKIDRAEIFAPVRRQAINSGAAVLSLTVAVLGIGAWFWRRAEAQYLRRELASEVALHESEARYRRYVDDAPLGLFVLDGEGHFVELNPAAVSISGYDAHELIGSPFLTIVQPQDQAAGLAHFQRAIGTGKTGGSINIRHKHGWEVTLEFSVVRLSPDRLLGFCSDVTAQRKAEESLQLFRALVDRSSDAIEVVDSETGRFADINERGCTDLGYTRAEMLTLHVWDIDPTLKAEDWAARVDRMRDGRAHIFETTHLRKDGTTFPVEVNVRMVQLDRSYQIAAVRDITERERAEAALRETQERFSELAENITEVFWITDPATHRVFYVSPAYERIWGRTCESVYDDPDSWVEAIHPEDRERIGDSIRAKVEAGPFEETYRILRPDGTTRWIRDRGFPVRDEMGRIIRVVGVAQDVTESRQLEAQYRQAQKMEAVGQLAGGVAHDFNNILSVITVHSDLLLATLPEDAPTRDSVADILRAAERAAGLTRQLLVFSRQQVIDPKVLDLNAVVRDSEKMLRRLIGEDVRLATNLAPGLDSVKVDPGQIGQVIMNLAVNARDAMPRGGQLTIETSSVDLDETYLKTHADVRTGPHVLLSITDTGCGMTPDVQARIFEPFFTTKGVGHGTGLGLAVVHGIVKQAGGHLNVYSEPGAGTTFKIYLPAVKDEAPVGTSYEKATAARGHETILLADDEESFRRVSASALEHLGYTVLVASSGAQAIQLADTHPGRIDLLLTDVVMPVMGGRELAEKLRARYPHLKVLYQSGYTDDAIVRHGILQAEVAFLQKPFTLASLAAKVREVLGR